MNTAEATRCRVCQQLVEVKYTMESPTGDRCVFFLCPCGTIFHEEPVDYERFNDAYFERFKDSKFLEERIDYPRRVYLPLIEELIYGRESLDIGYGFERNVLEMRARGWLAEGMDVAHEGKDFESTEFKDGVQFDLVILGHVLQSFGDPVKGLRKACGMVKPNGLIFISGPDSGLILKTGYKGFGHWSRENRTMMSKQRVILECVRAGMNPDPIVNWSNQAQRFLYTNDFHLIMQKGMA